MPDLKNGIILLDFYDPELYQKRFQSLFSFCKNLNYDLFEKYVVSTNEEYVTSVLFGEDEHRLDFFLKFKNSKRFPDSPWIIPLIEYMDESFLCATFPEAKHSVEGESPEYFQTKSFYFFIENTPDNRKFINLTSGNSLFFFRDCGLKHPITLRFLEGIDSLILKMEVLNIPLKTKKNEKFCSDNYNFVYFCNALKEFWNLIEDINYKVDSNQFYAIFRELTKKNLSFMYNN